MSLLAPLYALGALAVTLPVLLHLLRRTPRRRQTFGSLMFLTPSPPRFARRSRISDWLLLLLRASAIALMAAAFARPFFRQDVAIAADRHVGRRVALLVDTSASMRREDLWTQAKRQAGQVLDTVTPADEVSLYFFDRTVRPAFSAEQWRRLGVAERTAALRAALDAATPTWESTALGAAVARVADDLAADRAGPAAPDNGPRTLVLISDLQQGGHAEALQGHAWPESVRLDVRAVAPNQPGNAGLQLVRPPPDTPAAADDRPRVRVTNGGVDAEQFTLTWADDHGPLPSARPQTVYVPAGRGQTVRLDWPPAGAASSRIVLGGDAHEFDNTLFVARPRQAAARVVYLGDHASGGPEGLAFYLRTALGDTPQRRVDVVQKSAALLEPADVAGANLLVVGRSPANASAAAVRQFLDAGGDVLWVVGTTDAAVITGVTSVAGTKIEDAPAGGYALLGRLDTTHPLLAVFADARFGDFGRVHFWKHRKLTPPAGARVLAAFDDGDPFLVEQPVGRGRLFLMTSGWQPADSQLGLSSKFVPILEGLLRPRAGDLPDRPVFVGDPIDVGGKPLAFDRPGLQTLQTAAGPVDLAVNLRPDESRTAPIAANDFKQWGAKLVDAAESARTPPDAARQAQRAELEGRQKLWQWLLVGVLGLVAAETLLAGRLAKRVTA